MGEVIQIPYNFRLPQPIDIPLKPDGAALAEEIGLPEMIDAPEASAPAISAISDATLPGETLVLSGHGLEGASLWVWDGQQQTAVRPLQASDDRMLAVLPGDLALSTSFVWPVRDGLAGSPIRINGATVWWGWPARVKAHTAGQTARLFGKNLLLGDTAPAVYMRGPGVSAWLTVKEANPYHIEVSLPDNLEIGAFTLWAHNGTGGRFGWSEAIGFETAAGPQEDGLPVFHVENFGAVADSGQDSWPAITAAIEAAKSAGGGTVKLAQGRYGLSRPVVVNGEGTAGIHLVGAGMGEHCWENAPAPLDHKVQHRLSGDFTLIAPIDADQAPVDLIQICRRYSSIRDMTLITHSVYGKQRCLSLKAYDLVMERVRAIVVDDRPLFTGWEMPEEDVGQDTIKGRLQDDSTTRIDAPGKANIVIRNCEFHHPGAGIDTPPFTLGHGSVDKACPQGTDYIRIADCRFRGYFDGRLEPWLKDLRYQGFRGWHNMAWVNNNSKNVIVERCDIAGADKDGFKVTTRSLNHRNTSIRDLYLAHNTMHDVAPTSMSPGFHENKGEQIIFHVMYPNGGLFDVIAASKGSVTVDPGDAKYASDGKNHGLTFNGLESGSIPKDVEANPSHWIVFLCAGKGVGQYKALAGCRRLENGHVVLQTDTPWRVMPDSTSRVVLNAAYRRIIVYGNEIDGGRNDRMIKSHGVIFWSNSFENIVANNSFRNLTGGVVINSFYRCPTGWNLVRGNRMEQIYGNGGDTVFPGRSAFYVDHVRVLDPPPEYRVWYSVGNIFRSNVCSKGDVIAYLHRPDYVKLAPSPYLTQETITLLSMPRGDNTVLGYSYPDTPNGGIMLSVIENNVFEEAKEGLVVSSPVNWLLVRNNKISLCDQGTPIIRDEGKEQSKANYIIKGGGFE